MPHDVFFFSFVALTKTQHTSPNPQMHTRSRAGIFTAQALLVSPELTRRHKHSPLRIECRSFGGQSPVLSRVTHGPCARDREVNPMPFHLR